MVALDPTPGSPGPAHLVAHDHPPGAAEHHRSAVDGHPADRQDAVDAWVQARGLDVDGEQRHLVQRHRRRRERHAEVVAQRPRRGRSQRSLAPFVRGAPEEAHEM
jgi:hypothetical protein